MGCNSSKAASTAQPKSAAKTVMEQTADMKPEGAVEVYGVPGSMNCMGPLLLTLASKSGKMVTCVPREGTQTPEFKAMNPFAAVPCLKDGDLSLGESSAILRYTAARYAPEAYPEKDPKRCGFIDWAMDRFATSMYADAVKTIYACLQYASPPEDPVEAGKACSENLVKFAEVFLKEKFVGGSKLSIADYKLAPWFFAYEHPMLKEKAFVDVPERIRQFNKDFAAACASSGMLQKADGFAIKEMLDAKHGAATEASEGPAVSYETGDLLAGKKTAGKGKVEIFGVPVSMNCGGAAMLVKQAKLGDVVQCMPGEATRTPEFLAVNPYSSIPALKDGDFCLAESSAILRYLAQAYAAEYYPSDAKKRAHIDWAMDRFNTGMYNDAVMTIYVALGFRPELGSRDDALAAGRGASERLAEFASVFLKEKFVGGDILSIADFKVAPFFAAFAHPLLREKFGVEAPERIQKFNEDFAQACEAATWLREAGGFSVIEMLDAKSKAAVEGSPASAAIEAKQEEVQQAMAEEAADLVPSAVPEVEIEEKSAPVCGCLGL